MSKIRKHINTFPYNFHSFSKKIRKLGKSTYKSIVHLLALSNGIFVRTRCNLTHRYSSMISFVNM